MPNIQKQICEYLKKNDIDTAFYKIGNEHLTSDPDPDGSRFFEIEYEEVRSDQCCLQMTPNCYTRSGYLKIQTDGTIILLDKTFKPYESSRVFSFSGDKLECNTDFTILDKPNKYAAILPVLGFFAVAAVTALVVSSEFKYKA